MNPLAQTAQDKWSNLAQDKKHTTEHDELLTGLDRVQNAVLQGHRAGIAALSVHEPKVHVLNHPDVATVKDVNKVVSAVQDLIAVVKKQRATDIAPLIKAVAKLEPLLKQIPKQIDIPDNDAVIVTNLETLEEGLKSLNDKFDILIELTKTVAERK